MRFLLKEWSRAYSGQVPREWGEVETGTMWHKIYKDLRNPDFEPNATETEAAITYPIWHIPFVLATTRPLTTDQLMLLSAMPGIAYTGNAGDILVAQKGFGVAQQVLDRAASLNRRALINH